MSKEKQRKILQFTAIMATLLLVSILTVALSMIATLKTINILDYLDTCIAISLVLVTLYVLFYVYLTYSTNSRISEKLTMNKLMTICYATMSIGIVLACVAGSFISWFAMPITFVSLTIAILVRIRVGLMSTLITGMAILVIVPATLLTQGVASVDMQTVFGVFVGMLSGFAMVFLIRKKYSRFKLTWGALLVAVAMMPFSLIISFIFTQDTNKILFNAVYSAVGNTLAVGIITASLPLYERIFKVWTDFRLQELITLEQPLLKRMSEEAPGTFSHSMAIANLAESCAVAIGINSYMARVCAYYHDVGKIKNPQFFVENQKDGYNPHDELIPEVSVNMITRHTRAGYEMLKEANMPDEICKVALEHHGDGPVSYFYMKVKSITEGEVDDKGFCYEGPRPTTKYSAIIMICDICEAMFRAKPPEDAQALEKAVDGVIKAKLTEGQLDYCGLTMKDLNTIKQTICRAIPATMHKRIDYDKAKERR